MFQLKIGDDQWKVTFAHTPNGTACFIQLNGFPLIQGNSVRNIKDTPNKSVGRKLALARALPATGTIWFPKAVRKMFWDKYFEVARHGKH